MNPALPFYIISAIAFVVLVAVVVSLIRGDR